MKNTITVFIEFYFKGEKFTPSMALDLDAAMEAQGVFPKSLHSALARHNGIGSHSYELEIMESEEFQYKDAQGFAAGFLKGSDFDAEAFEKSWHQRRELAAFQKIANKHLDISDLEKEPKLYGALKDAYALGQQSVNR